jgi:23S rRNA (uracil1939-C5)-methyltransferase
VELSIDTLDADQRGSGLFDGRELRVAGALPGEQVKAVRVRSRAGFDEARVAGVVVPSPDRVEPRCRYFGLCGACTLQHLSREAQIRYKTERLFGILDQVGGVSPAAHLAPTAGHPWGYRRRARLGVRHVAKKGRVLVGFRERDAPYLADMRSCEVLVPEAGHRLDALSGLIGSLTILDRIPQVELAAGDDAMALIFRVLDPPTPEDRDRLSEFGITHGFQIFLQTGGPGTVLPLEGKPPPLSYRLTAWNVEIQFEPGDFIQVNGAVNEQMVARALELLDLGPGARVLELFSGLGNFTLPMARAGAHVTAVEGDPGLVDRARSNALRNGLQDSVDLHSGDLFESCRDAAWLKAPCDAVLLDPPRAGARRALEQVAAASPARIVYVSCNPETLAADAGMLVRRFGYSLAAAGVVDMFPHTGHLESMALFEAA